MLLRSLDGKPLAFESFSDEQNTWITLLFGGPGSGKSVLSNRLNFEMCMMAGLKRLPYVGVIDIGISSQGFISLVRDSLPDNMKHLAMYVRLQNREDYAINQFDTELGLRFPLPRQRELMKNFLVLLATPAERGKAHTYMNELAGRVLDRAFAKLSDLSDRGEPTRYRAQLNPWITERIGQVGIPVTEATRWWNIVDAFAEKGFYYEASVAQRYAMPTLSHLLREASDPSFAKEWEQANEGTANVVEEFKLMITAADGDYPLFRDYTRFDVGESRVMALDLQDVVPGGEAPDAKKKAALMYMAALNAFTRKVSLIKEDLDAAPMKMVPQYLAYHAKRIDDLAEDKKRLFVDEYHKTGDQPNLREAFLIFGRESRKWMLELVLASQLPDDFRELAKIATTTLIMDAGTPETRRTIRDVFGLNETEVAALRQFVNGPRQGGVTFLAKIKTKSAELSQLFTATSGGLELWALSTTPEDRRLRSLLYEAMSPREARRVLRDRFPSGGCKSYVLNEAARSKEDRGESFVDDDVEDSVIQALAKQLIEKWKRDSMRLTDPAAMM
jgi:intracellular multiplication protein IcmB